MPSLTAAEDLFVSPLQLKRVLHVITWTPTPFAPTAASTSDAGRAAVHSALSLPKPCSDCSQHIPTAWGWQGLLAGSQPASKHCLQLPSPLCWGSEHSPGQRRSAVLTSYSWENLRPSLALSRSMLSARSVTGMGGWSRMPAGATEREGRRRNGYSSALWARGPQHSKPDGWARGGHV